MQIPTFLLRKLYVKGSLENIEDGFQFKMKNSISNATAVAMEPLKVNGNEYPLESITINAGDEEIVVDQISAENTFPIKVGVEFILRVKGDQLSEGEHTIDISLTTKEVGKLEFDVKDSI